MRVVLVLAAILGVVSIAYGATTVKPLMFPVADGKDGNLQVDTAGRIHSVWMQSGGVYYACSSDLGQTFSTPMRVSSPAEWAIGGMFRGAQLSVDRLGTVHVIWYPNQSKLDPKEWGVRYARLTADSKKFSDPVNLGHVPSDNYSLATDGNGKVAVLWTNGNIEVVLSNDDGATFGPVRKIEGLDPCECCATTIAWDADGKLGLLYRNKTNDDRNIYYVPDLLGASEQRIRLNSENWHFPACPMSGNSLARLAEEGLATGWEEKGSVYVTILNPAMTRPTQVLAGAGKYPKVLSLPDGSIFVGWKQGSDTLWKILYAGGDERAAGKQVTGSSDSFGAGLSSNGDVLITP